MAGDRKLTRSRIFGDAMTHQETSPIDAPHFRDLFEGSVQGYMVTHGFKPIFANQAFADIFGYPDPETVLELDPLTDLIAPHENERLQDYRDARLHGKPAPATYEIQGVKMDGSLMWLENTVSIIDWQGATVMLNCVMNIDERKRAEQRPRESEAELHLLQDRAEQANQTKSNFLANVSHELRTPLNAIIGFSDIMRQQPPAILDDKKYREYADNIHESAGHLLKLITDILDISTIETGDYRFKKEAIQIAPLIAECFEFLDAQAKTHGVTLAANLAGNLPALQADRRSIQKILRNLLSNAVRFSPEGGTVSVSAAIDETWFTIIVADTGVGMPAADLLRLMDPFERGENDPYMSEDGAGLGLAITQSLVTLHGGTLDIAREVGTGTQVTVRLPAGR